MQRLISLVSRENLKLKLKHGGRYVKYLESFESECRQEGVASWAEGRAVSWAVARERAEERAGQGE